MIHALKTEAEYFESTLNGSKTFEVRKNDRDFMVGDILALNEFEGDTCTGRSCLVEVTYALTDNRFVKNGFAILGIRPCFVGRRMKELEFTYQGGEEFLKVPVHGGRRPTNDQPNP